MKMPEKIAAGLCLGVAAIVVGVLVLSTVDRDFRILLTADAGVDYPMPIYGILHLSAAPQDRSGPELAGADFSQVFQSARALRHSQSAYRPTSGAFQDRLGRLLAYPPLTNWLYVPISLLPYGAALMLHTLISICLVLAATLYLMSKAGLARQRWYACLVILVLYLLTPIGVTHLERGQFDLIVASAALLCLSCVLLDGSHPILAAEAGLLGAVKWTAAPFLFCFCVLGFLFEDRGRRWMFALVPVVMLVATVAFWPELREYWITIRKYEIDARPFGLTLQNFMPRGVARCVPPAITLAAAALIQGAGSSRQERARVFHAIAIPFALALMNVAVCFGTLSYEYHTVSTLGMIPALVVWTMREPGVSDRVKAVTCGAFGLFLCVVFRVQVPGPTFGPVMMTAVYLVTAVVFMGVCAWIAMTRSEFIAAGLTISNGPTCSSGPTRRLEDKET